MGPTFKLWGVFRVPAPKVLRSLGSGSWSHFYTMSILYHRICWVRHIKRVKSDFSGPSNNTNEELAIRGVLVEVCSGAIRELAKENILSVSNLANVFEVGWDGVLNTVFHKKYNQQNYAVSKKSYFQQLQDLSVAAQKGRQRLAGAWVSVWKKS